MKTTKFEMTTANQKCLDNIRKKNSCGINDIIAGCAPLIEAGTEPASVIARQIEIQRKQRGVGADDWPSTVLTQLIEKYFSCHSGLLSDDEHRDMTQQQAVW